MTTSRYSVLNDLLNFAQPVSMLAETLGSIDWDFDGKPVEFNNAHLKIVLSRYVNGELSAQDIEHWANLVERREDIDFEQNHAQLLSDAIYELANPELVNQLSVQRAKDLIQLL